MTQQGQNPNPGQGSQLNRRPNSGGGNPSQPKTVIRAYPNVAVNTNNTYRLMVETSAFFSGKPLSDQEVSLREGISTLDTQNLDVNGEVMLRATGAMTDQEQVIVYRICLIGLPEEKNLTVTIPAIKKIVNKKKSIAIASASTVDSTTNTAEIAFSCLVSEDTVIRPYQRIALMKGTAQIEEKMTDGNGRATFVVVEPLTNVERTVLYRVVLPGMTDEVEANVIIPAQKDKKNNNDPEDLILSRYHDGCGHFVITVRVLKAEGYGINIPGKIFYRGEYYDFTTDGAGEYLFNVPNFICEGDDFPLSATVSGIANEATVRIKRRVEKPSYREKSWWLITTNNGRGFILLGIMLIIWLSIITRALNNAPLISANLFRNQETGLSVDEELFNKSASKVDNTLVIERQNFSNPISSSTIFWLIIYSLFSIIYAIASWREEVMNGIEDAIELILDRNHGRAEDPALERWMKHFGISHRVKKAPVTILSAPDPASPVVPQQIQGQKPADVGGHPSIATLFQLDLLSDVLVTIVPSVLKKIFGK